MREWQACVVPPHEGSNEAIVCKHSSAPASSFLCMWGKNAVEREGKHPAGCGAVLQPFTGLKKFLAIFISVPVFTVYTTHAWVSMVYIMLCKRITFILMNMSTVVVRLTIG